VITSYAIARATSPIPCGSTANNRLFRVPKTIDACEITIDDALAAKAVEPESQFSTQLPDNVKDSTRPPLELEPNPPPPPVSVPFTFIRVICSTTGVPVELKDPAPTPEAPPEPIA
jgi:hypothetical protein